MSDRIGADRRVLSVIAPHSNSGKTLFVVHLLKNIDGLGCLKISPAHGKHGAFGEGDLQNGEDFSFEKPSRLCRPGKDTALYLQAGARQVERLRHRGTALASGLEAAFKRFPPGLPIVVESSSAVKLLSPMAVVLVVRPPVREMKPATERVLPAVTDLLINMSRHVHGTINEMAKNGASGTHPTALADADDLRKGFETVQPLRTWFADLASEPPPTEMLARLRQLLSARGASNDRA